MHHDLPITPLAVVPNDQPGAGYFRTCEIEINTACDLACFACDRFSDVASKGVPNMTVSQVALFVDESLTLNWEWERVRVLGGEPTLHPDFIGIIELLMMYRRSFPGCYLQVLSNSLGKWERYKDFCKKRDVDLHCERKERGVQPHWFSNSRIAPVDRDPDVGPLPPCPIFGPRGCGIALTRHGFFLDGAGASVARVAGHDVGVMSLREVTMDAMLAQAKVLCRICGHWNPIDGPQVSKLVKETGMVTGKFWTDALERWRVQRPVLRIYGEAERWKR